MLKSGILVAKNIINLRSAKIAIIFVYYFILDATIKSPLYFNHHISFPCCK